MSSADGLWSLALRLECTHRPWCCLFCVKVFATCMGAKWSVCVCVCVCWAAVDRLWGWMSYFICLGQWITLHTTTQAFTRALTHTIHAHEFIASQRRCLVNQNQGQEEFNVHACTQTTLHSHKHTAPIISIFIRVVFRTVDRFLSHSVNCNCKKFRAWRRFWGTNAHEQNKQKGYQIFMQLETRMGSKV